MANKIKKFLTDNKGSYYSSLAVKQLLIKFIELMSEAGSVKYEASSITELSPEILDDLQVGDIVQKITGKQKHCYIVTYKGEGAGEGICLSYCAAGYMETVSYDRSGSSWVYNSTDVVEIPASLAQLAPLAGKLEYQDNKVKVNGDATVGGALSANTVTPAIAEFEEIIEFYDITGITMTPVYCKTKLVCGVLHNIVLLELENTTESAISVSGIYGRGKTLPENIRGLIYDINGDTLNEAPAVPDTNILIRSDYAQISNADGTSASYGNIRAMRYNYQVLFNIIVSSTSIPAGGKKYVQASISLVAI